MTTQQNNQHLQAALYYADRGWPVVPVWWPVKDMFGCACGFACKHIGKHPISEDRRAIRATTDAELIRRWWQRWPQANVGLHPSTFNVCDIDLPNADSIRRNSPDLARILSKAARDSPVVQSGGGGWHYYFKPVEGSKNSRILPFVDWRTTNGLIIAPPSRHESGALYKWKRPPGKDLPDAPEAFKQLFVDRLRVTADIDQSLGRALSPTTKSLYGRIRLEDRLAQLAAMPREPSGRNNALSSLSGSCFRLVPGGWLSSAEIRSAFTAVALSIGLSPREVFSTLDSAERYGLDNPNGPQRPTLSQRQTWLLRNIEQRAVIEERLQSGRWRFRLKDGTEVKAAEVGELKAKGLVSSHQPSQAIPRKIWHLTEAGSAALQTGELPHVESRQASRTQGASR